MSDNQVQVDEAFSVVLHRLDGADVVVVTGELDLDTSALLRDVVLDPSLCVQPTLLVDLGHTTFIDSTGVAALVICRRRTEARGADFVIACANTFPLQVLSMAGITGLLEIHPSAQSYLAERGLALPTV